MLYFCKNEEYFMRLNKNGFTLIEMLVVIAIIAVLVSIIIPTVSASTEKAKAAADAANLRTVLGTMNVEVNQGKTVQEILDASPIPGSKLDPGAELKVVYANPGFIDVYYVKGNAYYGLDYLSDVAENGESTLPTSAPTVPDSSKWYPED